MTYTPSFSNYIAEQNIQTQINQEQQLRHPVYANQKTIDVVDPSQTQQLQQVPPQHLMQDNPFNTEQYRHLNLPDIPVNYGGGIAENLLNDNEVPEEIKKKFWFIFHKDNVLTFLDDNRQKRKLLNFDIMKIDILNAIPYYDYTFERELEFDVLRNVFETKLDRALGFRGNNLKNERIMLQSQFQEQRQISETGGGTIREGFFKRLLGRR